MTLDPLWGTDGLSVIVHVDPPKGTDTEKFLANNMKWKGRVDAVMVSDLADGIMRMTPLAAAALLINNGIRPVLEMNNRDRDRLAVQGDLLGAYALGVRDVFVKRGKDPSYGDHPLTRPANDLSRSEMVDMLTSLKAGKDMAGENLKGGADFNFGATVILLDEPEQIEGEFRAIQKIIDLGAQAFITSPIFDQEKAKTFVKRIQGMGASVLVGVMLLKSVGVARYLNEVPGIANVPDEVIKKMASSPEKAKAGIEVAAEMIGAMKGVADGVVLLPIGWEHKVPLLLDAIGR